MAEYTYTTSGSSTNAVWHSWNSSASASNDVVWQTWTDSTDATTSGSNTVWAAWTSAGSDIPHVTEYRSYEPPLETEEQKQAREEREQQRREELERLRLEKEAAQKKAEELLRETLEKEQLEQFNKTKWFFVISQSGVRYRIRHGWIGNIDELNELDQVVAEYCIHPVLRVPVEDSMLVQKLMLEDDEQRLLQIANKTTFREPRPLVV